MSYPLPSKEIPKEVLKVYESLYGIKDASEYEWSPISIEDAIKEVHGEEALRKWMQDPVQNQDLKTDVFLDVEAKRNPMVQFWLDKMDRSRSAPTPGILGKPIKGSKLSDAYITEPERQALKVIGASDPESPTEIELFKARNILLQKNQTEMKKQEEQYLSREQSKKVKESEERAKEEAFHKALKKIKPHQTTTTLDRFIPGKLTPSLAEATEAASRFAKDPIKYQLEPTKAIKPPSLMERFRDDPTELGKDDLQLLQHQLAQSYVMGTMSDMDYHNAQQTITDLLVPDKNINILKGTQKAKAEDKVEELNEAKVRLRNALAHVQTIANIQKGMDAEKAQQVAIYDATRSVNAKNFSDTFEYKSKSGIGLSKVRDAQLGIVYDEEQDKYRVADNWEMFKQVFTKQMISSPYQEEINKAVLSASEDIKAAQVFGKTRTSERLDKQAAAKLEEYFKHGIDPNIKSDPLLESYFWKLNPLRERELGLEGITRKLSLKKDLSDKEERIKAEIDEKYSKLAELPEVELDLALRGPKTLLKAAAPLLQRKTEDGAVYETPFGMTMRLGLGGPGAVWTAFSSELLPESLQREHDAYKRHQIINYDAQNQPIIGKAPRGNVVRQALVNWMLFQGGPEYMPAVAPLHNILGEEASWGLGVGLSMFEPVTGISIPFKATRAGLKATGALTKGVGKGLKSPKMMWTGQQIKNMAHPLQWRKTSQTVNMVDDMLEGRYKGRASLVRKELEGTWTEGELWEIFKKEAHHNKVVDRVTEEMSDLVATSTIIKRMADAGMPEKELLKSLPNTPTVTRYIQEARELMGFPGGKELTLEGLVIAAAREDWQALTRGAQKNPLARKALNRAEYAARVASEKNLNLLKKTTPLNRDLQKALFKINIAKRIEGELPPADIEKIIKMYDDLPNDQRTSRNLHKIFFGNEEEVPSMSDIILASSKSLRNDLRTGMLDYFPTDMVHMGGDVLVPSERMTKAAFKKYRREWNDYFGEGWGYIQDPTGGKYIQHFVPDEKIQAWQRLVKDEVGPEIIRESTFWADLLNRLSKGVINNTEFWKLRELLTERLAIDHFKGIRVSDAKEQWTRALTPQPLRDTFWKTGRKGDLGYQPSGALLKAKDVGRVLSNMFKSSGKSVMVRNLPEKGPYKPTPFGEEPKIQKLETETIADIAKRTGISEDKLRELNNIQKPKPGVKEEPLRAGDILVTKPSGQWKSIFNKGRASNAPALDRFITDMQNAIPKIEDMFLEELKAARKTAGTAKAADKIFNDTWDAQEAAFKSNKDDYVDRYVNGSYKDYLEILKFRGSDPEKKARNERLYNRITSVIAKMKGDVPDSVYRDLVLDAELYMEKLDAWKQILQSFYGNSSVATKILEEDRLLHDVTKKGSVPGAMVFPEEIKVFTPKASNIMDINLTNLNFITENLGKRRPDELKGMGMQTMRGSKAAAGALFPWAMRSRTSGVFEKQMRQFLDQNPQYAMDMTHDPLASGGMILDIPSLIQKYEGIAAQMLEEVPTGMHKTKKGRYLSGRLTQKAGDEFIKGFGEAMAKAHYESLNRISPANKRKVIQWITGVTDRKGTLRPNMRSIKNEINAVSSEALGVLGREYDKWASEAKRLGRKELTKKFREKQKREISDAFLGVGKEDGSMLDTAYGSLLNQYRQFWQASGATINDDIFRSIVENKPNILTLKSDDPRVMMFGKDHADTIKKFKEMITGENLKAFTDKLMARQEGRAALSVLDSIIDSTRTTTATGMLAGSWPIPGFRYNAINILTWPFIAASTTGTLGIKGVLKGGMNRSWMNTVNKITGAPPDKVMFTDKLGRAYTAGDLRYLYSKYHTGMSKQDVVYYSKKADEMMNELGMYITGQPKSKVTRLASKYVDPRNKNLFSQFAMGADNWVRKGVFWQALKEGHDHAAAAEIARRSILDYGQVDKNQRKALQRYLMFVSFKMMNMAETANWIFRTAKKDTNPGLLYNAIKFNAEMQKDADAWLYGDDDTKKRWFTGFRDELVADERVLSMGPMIPAAEAFEAYVNLSDFALDQFANGLDLGKATNQAVKLAKEGQWRPAIDHVIKEFDSVDPNDIGGKVPDEIIWWMRGTDTFDFFRDPKVKKEGIADRMFHFNIVPSKFEYRRLEGPTYAEPGYVQKKGTAPYAVQYRFNTKADELKFSRWALLVLMAGQKRGLDDIAKAAMAAEKEKLPLMPGPGEGAPQLTPGRYFGYRSIPTWLGYLSAVETPKVIRRKARRDSRKLDLLIKELEKEAESYKE